MQGSGEVVPSQRDSTAEATRMAPPPGSRIAVVGGAGGFGRPLVEACLSADLDVWVLDLPGSLERHTPPDPARSVSLDATDPDSVADAFARIGKEADGLDTLISLVGFTLVPPRPLEEVSFADWQEIIAGNLSSAHLLGQAALPLLRRAEAPAIVTVSSGLAYSPLPGYGPYAAAKAGLIALTKTLAMENAPLVRANAVAPSASQTAFMSGGTGRGGDDAEADWFGRSGYPANAIPLGRMCEPADVVGPVLFLAGPASRFITGQVLHVNGGRYLP